MPMTLWHALEHLEGDDVLRDGLGKTPTGDYVDYFVATKRAEVRASHAEVTRWELDRYLRPSDARTRGTNATEAHRPAMTTHLNHQRDPRRRAHE